MGAYCSEPVISLPCDVSLIVGKRHLKGIYWELGGHSQYPPTLATNLATKINVPENSRLMTVSLLGKEIWRFIWNIPCVVTHCREDRKYRSAQRVDNLFGVIVLRIGQLIDAECYC
ncbi:hypothetical protein AVEN_95502-1 [Araneus ventricosus]|uniref:Uncharacterized protein n=1 Tax=Araneus ventricosus TaxID=182803 RepID=A0A4Y2TXZ6_ARAVE|nr:hypothetical protein AVEN_109732-1 [Araneus ventricosus]GBN95564.1 hypothetical protein AVEN_105355-1 [Araneus ventricosus]GBO04196.1 hypothetical protein AVEN_227253-1 [Araneus ventricosus]GBO04198.1 hypothetical protein AVEN_95502-1 [Araneus ventricosus]